MPPCVRFAVLSRLRRQVNQARVHTAACNHHGSTDTAALPSSAGRSDLANRGAAGLTTAEVSNASPAIPPNASSLVPTSTDFGDKNVEAPSKNDAQSKIKKKKLKKRRFGFGRSVDDRTNKSAAADAGDQQGASRSDKTVGSSSSDDGKKATKDTSKKKKARKIKYKEQPFQTETVTDVIVEEEVDDNKVQSLQITGDNGAGSIEENPIVEHFEVPTEGLTGDVSAACVTSKSQEQQQQPSHQASSICIPSGAGSTADITTADSFRSGSSRPEVLFRQVECVVTKLADDEDKDDEVASIASRKHYMLIDNDALVTAQLHCSVQKGPELQRRPESLSKPELSQHHTNNEDDGNNNSLSPLCTDSPTRPLAIANGPLSPTLPVRTYGKNTDAGYLADVHGSLPVLTATAVTTTSTVSGRKYSSTGAGNRAARRGVEAAVSGDVLLPKSVSLHGNQLLTVASANAVRSQPKRRPLADGVGAIGRRTVSRLDIEHINRSQIFRMIAGEFSAKSITLFTDSAAFRRNLKRT